MKRDALPRPRHSKPQGSLFTAARARLCCLVAVVGSIGTGCLGPSASPSFSEGVEWLASDANVHALSVRVFEFYGLFTARVAGAADDAAARSTSESERRALVQWKTHSIGLVRKSTFRADSVAALFDTWVLCLQLRTELDTAAAEERFGTAADPLRATMDELVVKVRQMASTVIASDDLEPLATITREAATAHPIDGALYTRVSGVSEHADLAYKEIKLNEVVSFMATRVDDMARLATTLSVEMPSILRWEAELFLAGTLESLTLSAERMAAAAEELPDVAERESERLVDAVGEQREAIVEALNIQRVETLDFVQEERIAMGVVLRSEREALLEGIDQQREATLVVLSEERRIVVEAFETEMATLIVAVGKERHLAIEEVTEALAGTPEFVTGIVDHAFLRLAQLLGVIVVLVVVVMVGRRALVRG